MWSNNRDLPRHKRAALCGGVILFALRKGRNGREDFSRLLVCRRYLVETILSRFIFSATRIQFLAVEIARNREGWNKKLYDEHVAARKKAKINTAILA